jgi:catechol 2,3-dioxygenase-like lactoylglutathione lyase family enzyme
VLRNVHAVAIYTPELEEAVAFYQKLGLERSWVECDREGHWQRVGLRFPHGGPELVLHDDAARQFTEMTLCVDDLQRFYLGFAHHPDFMWLEPPNSGEHPSTAFVRLPDGNVCRLTESPSSRSSQTAAGASRTRLTRVAKEASS